MDLGRLKQLMWILLLTAMKLACVVNCQLSGGLRITSGFTENRGRLEIYHKGEWGTVCDNHFDNVDAGVACKQLGYCSGKMHPASLVTDGKGAIWLNEVHCSGSESKLLNCAYNDDSTNCRHNEDVGIHCFLSCSTEDQGGLRISAGIAVNQGRLEINYKGEWGTICYKNFDNVDAEVACKQLGYCSGIMHPPRITNNGNGVIWLNDVTCSGSEGRLLNCSFEINIEHCSHHDDVGVHCFLSCSPENEGGLRIYAGIAVNQGRLEINYKGEWGTICYKNFDNVDAEVACKQLGYCSGIMHPPRITNNGNGVIWLNDVTCSGSEGRLLNCSFEINIDHCSHHDDVGVHCFLSCSPENEGSLRIMSGFAVNQGRLDINYKGEWGTVCGRDFENVDAEVACKQLGYCSGIMRPPRITSNGNGVIWLNEVQCSGSESKLLNCSFNNNIEHCSHHDDVGVHCFLSCSPENEGSLRIMSGFAVNHGRLEINYKGEWGTVCGRDFENVDAEVACRQLGYCSGIMDPPIHATNGNGVIWLTDVKCSGSESRLLNCSFNNNIEHCSHHDDVGVHCFLSCSAEDEGGLRIIPGFADNQGRLEINYRGEWGTVCNKNFENVDAEVACKQLGYCSGIMHPAHIISNGDGVIWFNDVKCSGSESKLQNCSFNNNIQQCNHHDDVGVHCFLSCSAEDEGDLRIISGFAVNQGRLEVKYKGEWGTVCANDFENIDAEVACRQLGYCSGIMHPPGIISNGNNAIWLKDVMCSGSEGKLLNCTYKIDTSQCSHHDDVGIHCFLSCTAKDEGELRISAGYAGNQGRLEINYKGEWGTVCDSNFEDADAEVACRQLGYCSGIMHPADIIRYGNGAIWLNDVQCTGSERVLLNCTYNNDLSLCSHYKDVGVHCFLSCSTEDGDELRIADGYALNQGRLEINYRGEWGTICYKNFGDVDAEAACRQLGYCSGIMQPYDLIRNGRNAIWLTEVKCSGSESKLLNCEYNTDTLQCNHHHDVGVHCFLSCSANDQDSLRITDGFAENQGRLEVRYKGEWGTVCDRYFDNVDAEVACKQLGYCSGIMQPADLIRDGQGTIWLTEVKCSGSEITLLKCIYTTDTLSCSHYHDVGIHCFLNCSKEDEGVTPNEDVTQPTVSVVVVVILGVVVVLIGAVATLLVCWFRRRSSQFRTARSNTEPEHRSTPGPERSFGEPNNRSPPRNRRPLGEAENRNTIVSRSSNDHYDRINNMELSLSCSNSDYLEPSQGESTSNTEQQHDYCELRNTSGNSNVLESSETINASPAMPATSLTMRVHSDMPDPRAIRHSHSDMPESAA